jgi:hypothetical protein
VDWIRLSQNRDKWRAAVKAIINEDGCLMGCCAV